ncbi:MAG: hypothetical protein KDG57_20050 [Rhodoferax sp.]|nr:hypothetical protein [Rhodoferax sp.]
MTADHQLAELRDEVAALRGLVAAMAVRVSRDTMPMPLQRVVRALAPVCGLRAPFRSVEVLEHLRLAPSLDSRLELRLALQAVAAGRALDTQRIGLVLREALDAGGRTDCGLMLLRPSEEGHVAVWMLAEVRGA